MVDRDYYLKWCKDAESNRSLYIDEAKSKVVRWEYAEWERYHTKPYWFERRLESRAPVIETEEGAAYAYGFDRNDDLIFIQTNGEECFERTDDRLIVRRYWMGKLDSIEELTYAGGLPVKHIEFVVRNGISPEQSWHFEEDYRYEEGKLTGIDRKEYHLAKEAVRSKSFQLHYDGTGELLQITENGQFVYRHIHAEEAKQLRNEVKRGLVEESVKAIARIGEKIQDDSVCFIGIYLHGEPSGPIDPIFHPALQRIRDEQIQENEDLWTLWNAGEHPQQYQETLKDERLNEKFKLLMQYWQVNSDYSSEPRNPVLNHRTWWEESKAMWQEVAMELNGLDWNDVLPITETFVIFADEEALDVEGGDLAKSIPAHRLLVLEENGLLQS